MTGAPGFAELVAATGYSFLRGASSPAAMVERAAAIGLAGLGIADRNSVAGVVRAHVAARDLDPAPPGFRVVPGARLVFADATPDIIAYPANRQGWGRLTRLLTLGNGRAEKGGCILMLADLIAACGDLLLIALASPDDAAPLAAVAEAAPGSLWLGAAMPYAGADRRHLARLAALAGRLGLPLLATQDALYAGPDQLPLADLLTAIRTGLKLHGAGRRLAANAERHLKGPAAIARLFADQPQAVGESLALLRRIGFSLDQLRYSYPDEPVPTGWSAQGWLEHLVGQEAARLHPEGLPPAWRARLAEEFALVAKLGYARYFLTVHDIVGFARARGILCQGRGSAANSAICYLLGVTAVDPLRHGLLFSRFLSEERGEPPDIDIDFEHSRREEVIQYVYARYGRERAAIAAAVIHYRPRSAVREAGKALGLSEDVTARLAGTAWGTHDKLSDARLVEAGLDPQAPDMVRLVTLARQLLRLPRHLSQHVGGFVLTADRLDEMVPIHNAAMPGRSFIEWDKDDIDALGLMKVDLLALGMLSCIAGSFALLGAHGAGDYRLDNVPDEDAAVYAMLSAGDNVGVFQVESRAQINMAPRLRPQTFFDLVVQVAIVRPGPIEGEMVHPYLRRRNGLEPVELPSPAPPHDPDELRDVLGRTYGVPLFQEQAMKLAITAAGFSADEANRLRRAMATFRNHGTIDAFRDKMVGGMVARGYAADFAARCFRQIEGFGSYGFPEGHAQAFARLVYVSAWLKCHHPAVFTCALLNAQPMGFYAPAQLVHDAVLHGVEVRPVDVGHSGWDNGLEPGADGLALRLGFRQVDGFRREWADAIAAARAAAGSPFPSLEALARAARLPPAAMRLLADADACGALGLERRAALWEARRLPAAGLPLFEAAGVSELAPERAAPLPALTMGEQVATDYQLLGLSLKAHPMALLRRFLPAPAPLSAAGIATAADGARARMAGIVTVRQRPGKGNAIFITLEDETGITNVLLWARLFERQRRPAMAARLMLAEGTVQRSPEGVVHLIATRVIDLSALLGRLSEGAAPTLPARNGHPRLVRVLPRSRDFH